MFTPSLPQVKQDTKQIRRSIENETRNIAGDLIQLAGESIYSKKKEWRDTETWEEHRRKNIADRCTECGSDDVLHVHHPWKIPNERKIVKYTVRHLYENSDIMKGRCSKKEYRGVCPDCNGRSFYSRKTKEPEYRCSRCCSEFSKLDEIEVHPRNMVEYWEGKSDFLQNRREYILKSVFWVYGAWLRSYVEMRNIETLCQDCHFKRHSTPCGSCGERYYTFDGRPTGENLCEDCQTPADNNENNRSAYEQKSLSTYAA